MDGQANLTEALGLSIEEEQTVYGAMCVQLPCTYPLADQRDPGEGRMYPC